MYRRTPSEETLGDLLTAPELRRRKNLTQLSSVTPHLNPAGENDPYYDTPFGKLSGSRATTEVLSGFAAGPVSFLRRTGPDLRQMIMEEVLSADTPVVLEVAGSELLSAHEPDGRYIPMGEVVSVASRVLGRGASVINRGFLPRTGQLWLDTALLDVPPDGRVAVEGGDMNVVLEEEGREPQVGDLTRAGLSFFRNSLKDDLFIRLFLERLFCTNGLTSRIQGAEFRLKGSTAAEIIDQMEEAATRAFAMAPAAIEQFYELRDHPVTGDVTQLITRLATEMRLPAPRVRALALRAPEIAGNGKPTMFDVVNLFTNQANAPGLAGGARRSLMLAGGAIAAAHGDRCGTCAQVLA